MAPPPHTSLDGMFMFPRPAWPRRPAPLPAHCHLADRSGGERRSRSQRLLPSAGWTPLPAAPNRCCSPAARPRPRRLTGAPAAAVNAPLRWWWASLRSQACWAGYQRAASRQAAAPAVLVVAALRRHSPTQPAAVYGRPAPLVLQLSNEMQATHSFPSCRESPLPPPPFDHDFIAVLLLKEQYMHMLAAIASCGATAVAAPGSVVQ